jgi:hypothetical protein
MSRIIHLLILTTRCEWGPPETGRSGIHKNVQKKSEGKRTRND